MDPELVKKMLAVIESQDEKAALALVAEAVASMAGASPEPAPTSDPLSEGAEPKPAPAGEEPSPLAKALGYATDAEAADAIKKLQASVAKSNADAEAVELSARREMIAEFVKLGVEFPATAWAGKPEDRTPCERLAKEPIAAMRTRLELHKAKGPAPKVEPPVGKGEPTKLSKTELEFCSKNGLTPEQFQERKASAVRVKK